MASLQEAKQIVQRLTRKYGYLNEQMMNDIEQFNAKYRREIDENWLAMENAVSHSVNILAKQIYGSGARFVFELLQLAEDNIFNKAAARKELPFISFKIHPSHIIIDCNEDGFTERDMQDICTVGQSTKSASHGYIGAKGIGFKSVFIAASRVHIQSGNFSFEFRHNKTDPGIGMARPIWVDPVETIPEPLTRTTLYLHNQGDEDEIQHLKTTISMQFEDLHETCLIFLRKLQKITLEYYDEDGKLVQSKQFRKHQIDEYRISLETTSVVGGEETTQNKIFHILKQTAIGLAHGDNREIPDNIDVRRTSPTAEVILAFPLTSDFKPLVTQQKQDLFAFLPLKKSDYKFLIHSDFDMNDSRQDIITTSRRNLDLRSWIATTFLRGVLQFCEHATLCYEWPLFLPPPDDNLDVFWSGLNKQIRDLILKTPVLRSRHRNDLRLIKDICIPRPRMADKRGHPLLDDPVNDLYLSSEYSKKVADVLETYGLEYLPADLFVDLLEADLRSTKSKMRAPDTTNEWHSAMAQVLSFWIEFYPDSHPVRRLKSLPLLPLRNGEWMSPMSQSFYFPAIAGVEFPQSFNLRIISLSASENPDRYTLFQHLGVSEAPIDQVRASILRYFKPRFGPSLSDLKPYLDFLFLTHNPLKHTQDYRKMRVITDGSRSENPRITDIYLPGRDHTYSPMSLLAAQGTAPGLSVNYLHPHLMQDIPDRPSSSHPSWQRWICDSVGIRDRLRLLSPNGSAISDSFLYVLEHRPDRFLGLFEHLWPHEKSLLLRNQTPRSQINGLDAKSLCQVNFTVRLRDTWLPFKHLRNSIDRYMEHPKEFPFLIFEDLDNIQDIGTRWSFLTEYFSVGKDENVDFLLDILYYIEQSCPEPCSVSQSRKVFDLYIALYAKLAVAGDKPGARRKVREFFAKRGILDPNNKTWTSSPFCLWVAPSRMTKVYSLRTIYSRWLSDERMDNIEHLFQRTLEIRNAALSDLVAELENLRNLNCKENMSRISDIYKYLDESKEPISDIRFAFEESALIYDATQHDESGWYKTSDCLWSSEVAIRGKAILDGCWEAQKSFFIDKLGVKLPTLQIVYDELRQSPQNSISDMKIAILLFNSFLETEQTYSLDPEPIRKANIFPVRDSNGTTVLSSTDVDFAIGDREKLKLYFQGKISLLDFDLEDVCRLKPFFEWANLQDRYLSSSVEEVTSISEEGGTPISSHNRDLKFKAYHIARVAATFQSSRYKDGSAQLYEQLRKMETIETDGLSSVLRIFQNRKKFQVELAAASEHIDWISKELIIYVPKERKAQELCFGSVLPRKLASWLMVEDYVQIEAVNALTAIFSCDKSVLDDILDDQGIIPLPFDNEDETDEQSESGEEQEQEQVQSLNPLETDDSSSEQQATPTHSSMNDASQYQLSDPPGTESNEDFVETVIETISRQSHMSHQTPPRAEDGPSRQAVIHVEPRSPSIQSYQAPQYLQSSTITPHGTGSTEDVQYRIILNRVVDIARRAAFPSRGAFNMTEMRDALSSELGNAVSYESFDGLDAMRSFRSTSQLERDKRIGAAGELYVFELLSKLEMPGWGRQNWQSTIRTYVKIHPDYTNLTHWNRRETADLVYNDTEGHFTDTLIGCGYLDHDEWHGARPRYYIEVKTTTGPRDTPFYMSGNQYQLMGRIHHSENRSEVYIIFRVFWVNSDKIGLCIYFDPEQLRQDGRLVFTGQTWSITPGAGTEVNG